MANGFSGTMDWVLPDYAQRFAAAGMAALAFDYRYLGESIKIPTITILKLMSAAVWDGLRGLFGFSPFYVKVFGKPGEYRLCDGHSDLIE